MNEGVGVESSSQLPPHSFRQVVMFSLSPFYPKTSDLFKSINHETRFKFLKMEMEANSWDNWVEQALSRLHTLKLIRSLRPIHLPNPLPTLHDFEVFHRLSLWDRSAVEINISEPTFLKWVHEIPSSGTPFYFFCLVLENFSLVFPSFSYVGVFK